MFYEFLYINEAGKPDKILLNLQQIVSVIEGKNKRTYLNMSDGRASVEIPISYKEVKELLEEKLPA